MGAASLKRVQLVSNMLYNDGMQSFAFRKTEEMREILLDSSAIEPEIAYYMIRGGSKKTNITILEPGLVGKEYIKTYGHYHQDDLPETYNILEGEGIILLQSRIKDDQGKNIDNEIHSFSAFRVKKGDSIKIPAFAGHLLVNIGKTWLVTSDDSPIDSVQSEMSSKTPQHADYEPVKKMGGFAYFVIRGENGPALVKNEKYGLVPPAEILDYVANV